MYALSKKELYDKGWRGQFPPFDFEKLKTKVDHKKPKVAKLLDVVGAKLHHISPIEKMTKQEYLVPQINQDNCLECGRCFVACADSGY